MTMTKEGVRNIFGYCDRLPNRINEKGMFICHTVKATGGVVTENEHISLEEIKRRDPLLWFEKDTPSLMWIDCQYRGGRSTLYYFDCASKATTPTVSATAAIIRYYKKALRRGGGFYSKHHYQKPRGGAQLNIDAAFVDLNKDEVSIKHYKSDGLLRPMSIEKPRPVAPEDKGQFTVDVDTNENPTHRNSTLTAGGLGLYAVINGYFSVIVIVKTNDPELEYKSWVDLLKSEIGPEVKRRARDKMAIIVDGDFTVSYHPLNMGTSIKRPPLAGGVHYSGKMRHHQ